ncbi:MAG: hypothetical protein JW913_03885 [Chitinispirillaceae bacterium]|nr:hypothetical protein [Chitinispirillaceae bacterium]
MTEFFNNIKLPMSGTVTRFLSAVILVLLTGFSAFTEVVVLSSAPPAVIFEMLALNRDLPTLEKPKYLSPTDLAPSPDGRFLYVAEQTAKRIDVIDLAAQTVVRRIRLPNEVTGIAVAPDGKNLYATCSSDLWPAGQVCVVDVAGSRVTTRIPAGHGARAPVITPDGSKLFVCNRFDNNVSMIDLAARREGGRISAVREPYCAAMTPDGKTVVVGNLLPGDRSNDTMFVSCQISIIDVKTLKVDTVRLRRGSHSVCGIAVSYDGKYAFATHMIGKFNLIATSTEKGHLHTNNVAVIDIENGKLVNEVCLDLSILGMGDPWGIRCTDDGAFMVVTHAGANELSIIDYPGFIDTVLARSGRGENLQKEFTLMLSTRKRVQVQAQCPRAVAVIGSQAYVAGYFSDNAPSVEGFNLSLETKRAAFQIQLDQPQTVTSQRRGEALFYDASLSFQKWQTCHSCHSFTRPDGLNWILGGGAVVAPKNSKSMLYTWWTPQTMWTGRRGHAEKSIPAAIELEMFRIPADSLALPLDTFIMYLKPTPGPHLIKGRLSDSALRGKALFLSERAGCFHCHNAPLYCDLQFHNAGVPDPYDANTNWDTPSLVEAWRTGPYGHLGSFSSIGEMVKLPGHNNASQTLSSEEMEDLLQYVLSL